ncbi:MAG: chorismate synthase, partial [Muribaculaceae bacterium]|nr:chorismate synthase [Muribaculaceae bacterium]
MSNTFGDILRITTFGESHGPAMGGIIDGFPAGVRIDLGEVQRMVDRRRPGQSTVTTARDEKDRVEVLSGMLNGVTLGTPIGFIVRNADQRSVDYESLKDCYRPSHADYTYAVKYGIRDHRGGGRASARETVCRVVAGAFAQQALRQLGIEVTACAS